MTRTRSTSLLTAAVLGAACALVPAPSSAAARPGAIRTAPVIVVDDDRGIGVVGDRYLSLAEAIRLANGTLSRSELSTAESARVAGSPGATSADVIRVSVARIVLPHTDPGPTPGFSHHHLPSALPVLHGNEGDVLDGAGTTMTNGPEEGGPIGGLAFLVRSSDVTITGWRLERFFNMVEIDAPDAGGLRDVAVTDNVLHDGGGVYVDAVAADGARATVERVSVLRNRIIGPPAVEPGRTHAAFFNLPVHAAAATDTDPAFDAAAPGRSRIVDLRVEDNHIRGFSTGGSFLAISASGVGNVSRGDLARLVVAGNDVELPAGAVDPGFMVWGIAHTTAGTASDARVRAVRVLRNRFRGGTLPFYAAAAENVFGAGAVEDVRWRGLTVRGNTMLSAGACAAGLMVTGAFQELGGGSVRDVRMADVAVAANTVRRCRTGMLVAPSVFLDGVGTTTGVTMTDVDLVRNTVTGAGDGAVVAGAAVLGNPAVNPDVGTPGAVASGNVLRGLSVRGNHIAASAVALRLHGGFVSGAAGNVVVGNELLAARVGRNVLRAPARCLDDSDAAVPPAGAAVGNTAVVRGC